MNRSTERDLALFGETFALLGIEVRRNRLFDGQGPSGRIHVTHPWALLIFDRWREEYMVDQVQLVVPVDASVNDLWEWINDAAGIWAGGASWLCWIARISAITSAPTGHSTVGSG